jgi:hypothetical protein
MSKDNTVTEDDLAVDALLVAACNSGELDPNVSAKEAKALSGAASPLTRRERAAFAACGDDPIAAIRRRLEAAERGGGVGFVQMRQELVYATGADQERDAERSVAKLHRARKRLKKFLGE